MELLINKAFNFVKTNLRLLTIIWFVLIVSLYAFYINKSIYFADEVFYFFYLIPDLYKIEASQWHKVYNLFIFNNLVVTKIVFTLLHLVSVAFFSWAITNFFSSIKTYKTSIAIATITSTFLLVGAASMKTPYYITIGVIICLISTSFLLLYLKKQQVLYLVLSGFFIGVLPFLMVTSSLTPFLFVGFLWLYTKSYKDMLLFCCGALAFVSFYFLIIQTPTNFINKFTEAVAFMKSDSGHGIGRIFAWVGRIFIDKITLGAVFIGYYYLNKRYHFNKILNILVVLFFCLWLSSMTFSFVFLEYVLPNTRLFYFLSLVLFIFYNKNISLKNKYILVFLLVLPFFALLGTNISFYIRSRLYFPFIFIALLLLVLNSKSKRVYGAFFIILFIHSIMYVWSPFRENREGFKGFEQTEKYEFSKGKIYLDKERLSMLNEVKPFVTNKNNVIVSHALLHGYVYLNEAKPPFVFFSPDKSTERFLINNKDTYNYKTFVFLESKKYPFADNFLNNVTQGAIKTFKKTVTDNFIIYKYEY